MKEVTTRASEEKYRTIFDSVNDAVFIHDPDNGAILEMNRKMTEMFGYTLDEARTITVEDISSGIPPYDQKGAIEKVRAATIRDGLVFEWQSKDRSGRIFWTEVSLKPTVIDGTSRIVATVRDIDTRKNAEERLKESESRYHSLFENNHAVMLIIDPDTGRILDANPAAAAYYGYSREQLTSMSITDINMLASGQVIREMRLAESEQHTFHFRHRLASGKVRDVQVYSGPIVVSGKTLLYSIIHDITERVHAEKALIESERKYRELVENANSIIIRWNRFGEITFLNEFGQRFFGYSETEILGKNVVGTIVPETESTGRDLQRLMEEIRRDPRKFEHNVNENLCRDGTRVWIDWTNKTVMDQEDEITEILSIGSDITKRKRAEEALLKSEERLGMALEGGGMGMWEWDVVNNRSIWNDKEYELFNLPVGDGHVPTELFFKYVHPEDLPGLEQSLKEVMKEGSYWTYEMRVIRRDKQTRWLAAAGRLFRDEMGQPVKMLGVNYDITERKQAEEELRRHRDNLEELVRARTMELEEKNRDLKREMAERVKAEEEKRTYEAQIAQAQRIEALDRFAGGIAHDLNNILYPVLLNIEELLAESPVESPQHELLEQTMKSVIRQKDLVKKILSFSRRAEEELKPIKLTPLVEETLDFLRSTLPSTLSIKHKIDVSSDMIMGDPTQVQQVIMNLVQNAADSFPTSKGTIEVRLISTHLEPVRADQGIKAGEYLELTVKDTGSGIPPDVLNHVFEPFYTTKGIGRGSGMGLSVVYGIVKRHGGTVNVQSQPGKGSVFTVYLPIYSGEAHAQAATPETGHIEEAKEKILLVDDEEYILSSLQRALKISGYRVVAVKDGVEALRLFKNEPFEFDLIITDLTMPKMTGIELTRKIQKIRPDIPVILSTGFNDVINEQEASSLGIRELLLKPAESKELKKKVRKALEHYGVFANS